MNENVWLSTQRVIQKYGFDPKPYLIAGQDGRIIRSKLLKVEFECDCGFCRYWLEDDVKEVSIVALKLQEQSRIKALSELYTKRYTKGLRKGS